VRQGFAFLSYENQKSTVLAVDNLNGAKVRRTLAGGAGGAGGAGLTAGRGAVAAAAEPDAARGPQERLPPPRGGD